MSSRDTRGRNPCPTNVGKGLNLGLHIVSRGLAIYKRDGNLENKTRQDWFYTALDTLVLRDSRYTGSTRLLIHWFYAALCRYTSSTRL